MFSMVDGIELSNGVIGKLGGGVPLTLSSGVSVGSIGISGAMTPGEDEVIALAAAAEINDLMEKAAAYKAASALTLAEAMASNPSSKISSYPAFMKCPLVPAKFSEAPVETAMIYWERSMTFVAPGLAVDTEDMVERPVMMWNADPTKLYTVIAIDEGITSLSENGLGFLHWVVTNVPGDKVSFFFNLQILINFSLICCRCMLETRTTSMCLLSPGPSTMTLPRLPSCTTVPPSTPSCSSCTSSLAGST